MLQITSCADPVKWYSSLVDKYVPLLDVELSEYKSREPAGYINFVSINDGIIVEVDEDIDFY